MFTFREHHFSGSTRSRTTSVVTAIVLLLTLLGHDALMAGDAHASSVLTATSMLVPGPHDGPGPGKHDLGERRHHSPSDVPAQPCSTMREAASRTQPDALPDDLAADPGAGALPIAVSHAIEPRPIAPLPASVRRALLQVFLN